MKKQELAKQQRTGMFLLFVEFVAMPMLAVSVAVLIAAIATYDSSPSARELCAIGLSVVAIPFLAMTVFFRKAVATINPKLISKKEPESLHWAESIGLGGSLASLCFYIASVDGRLVIIFLISICIAFAMHVRYLIKAKKLSK